MAGKCCAAACVGLDERRLWSHTPRLCPLPPAASAVRHGYVASSWPTTMTPLLSLLPVPTERVDPWETSDDDGARFRYFLGTPRGEDDGAVGRIPAC